MPVHMQMHIRTHTHKYTHIGKKNLESNSKEPAIYSLNWPLNLQSPCLSFLCAGVIGLGHHIQLNNKFFLINLDLFYVYEYFKCICLYMCAMYVPSTPRGQKASDSGELVLQMIIRHSVGTKNGNPTNFLNY